MSKAAKLHEKTIKALERERESNSLKMGQNEIWTEKNEEERIARENNLKGQIERANEEIARKKNEYAKWVQDSEIEAQRRDQENNDLLERNLEITRDLSELTAIEL